MSSGGDDEKCCPRSVADALAEPCPCNGQPLAEGAACPLTRPAPTATSSTTTPAATSSSTAASSTTATGGGTGTGSGGMDIVSDFDKKWAEVQALMGRMGVALARNLQMYAEAFAPPPLPPKAERTAVFSDVAPSPEAIARKLAAGHYKNIIVCCGAGMSTSADIPDFRSPDTGIYATLRKQQEERRKLRSQQKPGEEGGGDADDDIEEPQDLFSIDFFKSNPKPFILRAGHLWPGTECAYRPTPAHCFLRLLLPHIRRVYTQNIDELECWNQLVPRDKVRRCHGGFETVHCVKCDQRHNRGSDEYDRVRSTMVIDGLPARCQQEGDDGAVCGGLMKPGIVFFGESMSSEFKDTQEEDMASCDLCIVVGTSLTVKPFAELPDRVSPLCPRLLLNNELVGPFKASVGKNEAGPLPEKEAEAAAAAARKKAGAKAPSSPKAAGDEKEKMAPNYRDVAMVMSIDKACSTLAGWMGKGGELAKLTSEFECKKKVLAASCPPALSKAPAAPTVGKKTPVTTAGKRPPPTQATSTATKRSPPPQGAGLKSRGRSVSKGRTPTSK